MSTSRAADAGYLALQDLAAIAAGLGGEYRIVGGAMVGLLAAYYAATGLAPDRETVDADFGAAPELVADARLVQELQARGYQPREAANRFVRHDRDLPLVIDVLAPSFQGRLRANQRHGDLTVDEIPGLSLALARTGVTVALRATLTDRSMATATIVLPDVCSALCLKAYSYRGRLGDRDAVDIWRLLETARSAGVTAEAWPRSATGRDAAAVLHGYFGRPGAPGPTAVSGDRRAQARIRALVTRVVAPP